MSPEHIFLVDDLGISRKTPICPRCEARQLMVLRVFDGKRWLHRCHAGHHLPVDAVLSGRELL